MSENNQTGVQLVKPEDLSLVPTNFMNPKQLAFILKHTPPKYVRKRKARGGGEWDYVSGGYVKKTLNLLFGFDWDFEILHQEVLAGEAIVKGKLTCRSEGRTIVKMQFGNKEIIYKKELVNGERVPLSIGNDLKSAATDALKKCASELGIAADIYNREEFRAIFVNTQTQEAEYIEPDLMDEIREKLKHPMVRPTVREAIEGTLDIIEKDPDMQKRTVDKLTREIADGEAQVNDQINKQ